MLKDIAKVTFDQLDEFGIPYDEIHFGKPHADVYIDGKSVNPTTEFAKTLGTYTISHYPVLLMLSAFRVYAVCPVSNQRLRVACVRVHRELGRYARFVGKGIAQRESVPVCVCVCVCARAPGISAKLIDRPCASLSLCVSRVASTVRRAHPIPNASW